MMYPVNILLMQMFSCSSTKPAQRKYPTFSIDTEDLITRHTRNASDVSAKVSNEFVHILQPIREHRLSAENETVSNSDITHSDISSNVKPDKECVDKFSTRNNSCFTMASNDDKGLFDASNNINVDMPEAKDIASIYRVGYANGDIGHIFRSKHQKTFGSRDLNSSAKLCTSSIGHHSNNTIFLDDFDYMKCPMVGDCKHILPDSTFTRSCAESVQAVSADDGVDSLRSYKYSKHDMSCYNFVHDTQWFKSAISYLHENIRRMLDRRKRQKPLPLCGNTRNFLGQSPSSFPCSSDYHCGLYFKNMLTNLIGLPINISSYTNSTNEACGSCVDKDAESSDIYICREDINSFSFDGNSSQLLWQPISLRNADNIESNFYVKTMNEMSSNSSFDEVVHSRKKCAADDSYPESCHQTSVMCCWFCSRVPGLHATLQDVHLLREKKSNIFNNFSTYNKENHEASTHNIINVENCRNYEEKFNCINDIAIDSMPSDNILLSRGTYYSDVEQNGSETLKISKRVTAQRIAEDIVNGNAHIMCNEVNSPTIRSKNVNTTDILLADNTNNSTSNENEKYYGKNGIVSIVVDHEKSSHESNAKIDSDALHNACGCMKCLRITSNAFVSTLLCIFCLQCPLR